MKVQCGCGMWIEDTSYVDNGGACDECKAKTSLKKDSETGADVPLDRLDMLKRDALILANARRLIKATRRILMADKFIIKHYSDDERPTVKGNGFDGLTLGEDREEAEEFISFVNKIIEENKRLNEKQRDK